MIEIAKEKAAKAAKARVTNVKFEAAGIHQLANKLESSRESEYGVVLGLSILHLLPDKQDAIAKAYNMLKPGGVFVTSTACIGDFLGPMKFMSRAGVCVGLLPTVNSLTSAQLKESIKKAGFEIEEEFQPDKDMAIFHDAKKK